MATRVLAPPPALLAGRATIVGTDSYIRLFAPPKAGVEHFRRIPTRVPEVGDILVSSLGIGTGNGLEDDETDHAYGEAIIKALELGINVIDTSISYRSMRSERAVGHALHMAVRDQRIERAQVVVCTKGGYLTFECDRPAYNLNPKQWIESTYFKRGIITTWADIVHGYHCITPRFLRYQVEKSRMNLGVDIIDVYYLQNPEIQLLAMSREEFNDRLLYTFKCLEKLCEEKRISVYGVSSWDGFRVPPHAENHLSLEQIMEAVRTAGGEDHHFRVLQVPLNLQMRAAADSPTQHVEGRMMSLIGAAQHYGLVVTVCGTLNHVRFRLAKTQHLQNFHVQHLMSKRLKARHKLLKAKLTSYCDDIIRNRSLPTQILHCIADLGEKASDAQCALQFARTTPNVVSAVVGMRNHFHVDENTEIIRRNGAYQYHPVLNVDPFTWRLGD